jgi:uncharacterized protein involved in exopolysaccharide biosynthesis
MTDEHPEVAALEAAIAEIKAEQEKESATLTPRERAARERELQKLEERSRERMEANPKAAEKA